MKKAIKEYWQLAMAVLVIAFAILVMCCGCKAPDHLRESTKMMVFHKISWPFLAFRHFPRSISKAS
jgi:hypothetical protein